MKINIYLLIINSEIHQILFPLTISKLLSYPVSWEYLGAAWASATTVAGFSEHQISESKNASLALAASLRVISATFSLLRRRRVLDPIQGSSVFPLVMGGKILESMCACLIAGSSPCLWDRTMWWAALARAY